MKRRVFVFAGLLLAATAAQAQMATTVLVHGKVWTENPKQPEVEAVAVAGDRILAVGTTAEMMKLAGPKATVIDAKGARVLPGFNDSHVHFIDGGASLASVQLRETKSEAEFRQRIADFAKTLPKGEWMTEGNWDHERWPDAKLPYHQLIDDVTPDTPVAVSRLDGHMLLANALAMKLAGVDKNTSDVPGGVIERDAQGNPTGIFKDAATALIAKKIPPMSDVQVQRAIVAACRYAAEHGVTSVQNMAGHASGAAAAALAASTLKAYERARREGTLTVRMAWSPPLVEWREQASVGIQAGFGDALLQIGGVKGFADGSLGSRTAWMLAPYADDPSTSGIASAELTKPDEMYADAKGADAAGIQLAIHAIGDRANRTILDFYERIEKENPTWDRRLRIEHAQHLTEQDIPRFAQLHVIASMQPYHAIDDGRWAVKRIGDQRLHMTHPWRTLLDSGATIIFGSDWPVAPMDPLMGIYAAVTRRTLDDKNPNGWGPEQRIKVTEAVHAFTAAPAYAEYREKDKGTLEPGKLADMVVLSDDILHEDPVLIEKTRVEKTILGGRVIYDRTATAAR
jgi:predicted amidohydrolase YtcJ